MKSLMEAVMIRGQNISERHILMEFAQEVARQDPAIFSARHFFSHYNDEESRSAFLGDLQKCRMIQVGRFPTVTLPLNKPKPPSAGERPSG